MALPTLWDCSLRESEEAERDEPLLVEEEPICLATLSLELLTDEEDRLSEEELLAEDDELREEEELLAEEDELLDTSEVPLLRLLSRELLETVELLRRLLS